MSQTCAPTGPETRWFLSFDCATKSFAYSLVRVRAPGPELAAIVSRLAQAVQDKDAPTALAMVAAADAESVSYFHLAGGGAVDLVPGRADKSVSSPERINALVRHLRGPVARMLEAAAADGCPAAASPALNVAVEFQMGANAPARTVAMALLTFYSGANTFMVGPALKNKLWYPAAPKLRISYYYQKYANTYSANKAHSRDLYFEHLAPLFGHDRGAVLKTIPKRFQKDFADSVTQILGILTHGDLATAMTKF